MKRTRYTKLLTGLAYDVSRKAMEAADMVEIDDPDSDVSASSVMKSANEIRERLLWIERAACEVSINDEEPNDD